MASGFDQLGKHNGPSSIVWIKVRCSSDLTRYDGRRSAAAAGESLEVSNEMNES